MGGFGCGSLDASGLCGQGAEDNIDKRSGRILKYLESEVARNWEFGVVLGFGGRVRGKVRGRYGDSSGMAAAGGRVEGNMRLARAIPVADRGSVSYMAAASAMQPAAGLQQLPRLHIVSR